MNNPYDNYKQQSVMTMTHGEMLVKLYDEVLKQINIARHSIQQRDMAGSNQALQKCQTIIGYLDKTLDKKYDVSAGLSSLYDYFNRQIVAANVQKDATLLEDIAPMITELRDTFVQAEKLSRMGQSRIGAGTGIGVGAVG